MSSPPPGPGPQPGEAPDPLVGQLLADRYRIVAKLGEGAMGAVYVGEHLRIGRRDAIKVLRPGLAGDPEAIARFTRGTRNVSAIRHPNVCTIYDFSDTPEGVRYLAMEFVEGDTLKDVLDREGRLETARAVEIARQTAEALQAAHEVGVVHRDLKPGNIMICRRPDGRDLVKVVDFDIAKGPAEAEGEEVTRMGFVVGTPEYMSPEQLIGDRLDGRSDLYSLGVVLFRMLSGALPFRAANTQEIMMQRLTGEPLRLEEVAPDLNVPPALRTAIARSLARRAEDRQASAAEFAHEIVAALGSPAGAPLPRAAAPGGAALAETRITPAAAPVRGREPVAAEAPKRRLSPAVLAGSAVLVIAGVAGAALYLTRDQEPVPQVTGGTASADTATQLLGNQTSSEPEPEPELDPGTVSSEPEVSRPPVRDREPTRPQLVVPGGVTAMLARQADVDPLDASPAQLRALRDSAQLGWQLSVTRADSASAAALLANLALTSGDNAECLRWARRAVQLGDRGSAVTLVRACQ